MDKRWYPVAFSVAVIGCGGDVNSGSPAATGGYPSIYYGVPVGGTSATGGAFTGGTASVGGATSTIDVRACLADSDCTQCVYVTAPRNSVECANALGCCGGQTMNKEMCNWNQGAWEANCSGLGYTVPICPCVLPSSDTVSCKNGECGFW